MFEYDLYILMLLCFIVFVCLQEDEEYPVEIDIDELIELSEAERSGSIQQTLRDATQPSEVRNNWGIAEL